MAGRFVDNEGARRQIVQRKADFLDTLMGDVLFIAWLMDVDPVAYNELTKIYPTARRAIGEN